MDDGIAVLLGHRSDDEVNQADASLMPCAGLGQAGVDLEGSAPRRGRRLQQLRRTERLGEAPVLVDVPRTVEVLEQDWLIDCNLVRRERVRT